MIKKRQRGNLIVISGPSGSGKGTICSELLKKNQNLWISISCTTRDIRPGDIEGKTYYFISKEEFEERIGNNEFLEFAKYNDNYYGTLNSKIEEKLEEGIDVILEIEVQGALKVKNMLPDTIFIFIMPPSMKELKTRLENRKTETKEKVLSRFKIAYKEINEYSKYNYVVVNDNLSDAVNKVQSIIISTNCRVDRIEELDLDNIEEVLHEDLIDMN